MRYSLFSALALGLSAVVQAGVSSPPAGAQWPVAQNQQITWDTTGLTGPVDIHLVPAGAVDITVIIAEIAIGVSNTGSFTWAPDSTISTPNVEIIIVDAKQVIVISEVFEIIIVEVTSTQKLTTKLTTTPTKTSTVLKLSTVTKLATVSSVVTTKPLTTTVNALITTTSIKVTTLTTPAILMTTTKPLNTTSTKLTTTALGLVVTTTSKPLTTSTSTKALNTSTSSIRVNATVVAATSKATFTGAAAHLASSNTYSLVSGGLLGLIAMIFL